MKTIIRAFIKLFYWPIYLIVYRNKIYHENKLDKTSFREPLIIVSNYSNKTNSLIYSFVFYFRKLTFYINKNIKKGFLNICDTLLEEDFKSYQVALNRLKKGKKVFFYSDYEINKDGKIKVSNSLISRLSKDSGAKVVSIYINEFASFPHRTRINISKPFNLEEAEDKTNLIKIRIKLNELKKQLTQYKKYHTYNKADFYFWFYDLCIFLSLVIIPKFYIFFPTKYVYSSQLAKKSRYIKGKGIVIANHRSFLDPLGLVFTFLNRRIRIVAAEDVFGRKPIFNFILTNTRMIKYHRESNKNGDVSLMDDCNGVLNTNGLVALYPEGHVDVNNDEPDFNPGVALMSLMNKSPIYPICFLKPYQMFRKNIVMIGKPIYPSDFVKEDATITTSLVNEYTLFIQSEYNKLRNEGKDYLLKKGK